MSDLSTTVPEDLNLDQVLEEKARVEDRILVLRGELSRLTHRQERLNFRRNYLVRTSQ